MSAPRFYKPKGSSHYHEIIECFPGGTLIVATHASDNGWMTYRGSDIVLCPSLDELLDEIPVGVALNVTSVHTAAIAGILKNMRTIDASQAVDTVAAVRQFARRNSEQINALYRQKPTLELQVFAAYVNTAQIIGHATKKDQVKATVMKAHATYVARLLGVDFDGQLRAA